MTLPIERARSRKPITWLTIVGILLLPAIIGGILVAALQNPTERLDRMTAAVVNLDEPVTIDGQYTPLGRQLAAALMEGSDDLDSNLTWMISNEDDAAEGLEEGSYQAVITIPENFSAAATSSGQAIAGADETPEQATIEVTTPEDGLVADDLITSQIASAAASGVGTMLSEATLENVLVGFTTMGDQLGDAADGATQLADGTAQAADGAAELPDGATQLADGVIQLGDGASQLAGGAAQLGDGAGALAAGLDTIESSTLDAADGATALGEGLLSGAAAMTDPKGDMSKLVGLAGNVSSLAATAAGSTQDAAAAVGGVAQNAGTLAGDLGALAASCDPAVSGEEFCTSLATYAADAVTVATDAGAAAESAVTAATDAGTTAGYAAPLSEGVSALPGTLSAQLTEAGNGAVELGGGLQLLAGGIGQSADGARELATGASGISSGASELSSGAGQLGDGATQLADGASELVDGLGELADGSDELAGGLATAVDEIPSFTDDESSSIATVVADPVSSNATTSTIFGPTAIPLLAAVVLWFGALATFLVLRPHTDRVLTSRRPSVGLALRAFAPAALIGAGQGLLVALIVQIVANYAAGVWWGFAGVAVLAGVSFAAVNQALVAVFGGIGRWISALIGVLAVATGLISTVPAWLASLGAAMPTASAFAGLIAPTGSAVAALVIWGVLALGATTLAVALRRTTSAKAVLAT